MPGALTVGAETCFGIIIRIIILIIIVIVIIVLIVKIVIIIIMVIWGIMEKKMETIIMGSRNPLHLELLRFRKVEIRFRGEKPCVCG